MKKINDLDLTKWNELTDVWTDSLWIIPQRDNSGAHDGHYHGNFVPQIPHQLLTRYTKAGDFVKATIIKNFEETKGKANQRALWRQRALKNGLYLFKHEYIFVFKKEK